MTSGDRIRDGKLPPGARIGTFGSLGKDYDAAKGTVDKALDVLRQEGAVVTIAGKGIFVAGDANRGNSNIRRPQRPAAKQARLRHSARNSGASPGGLRPPRHRPS